MMVSIILVIWISFLCLLHPVNAFASWFAEDYCSLPLIEGEIIMNSVVTRSDKRKIEILRNDVSISNGASYVQGETLYAILNGNDVGELVFEANVPLFDDGGCNFKRCTLSSCSMFVPEDITSPIEISAGKVYSISYLLVIYCILINRKLFKPIYTILACSYRDIIYMVLLIYVL